MIVAYDIADPRRLTKVAKVMEDYGVRVQKSIFEVELKRRIFNEMKRRIERIIDAEQDSVKYYPLCSKCRNTLDVIGLGQVLNYEKDFIIL
ncbi:MAG: CRISPR-associated endonuclease Cas2 [Candidatus Dadabacteria bacterium]|nr:MAG: CRISPR-associated endonuclease Cas2 [Candidatus Dadabacteria bacterium]